jgi:7-cyano-7-deazaguanine reductase
MSQPLSSPDYAQVASIKPHELPPVEVWPNQYQGRYYHIVTTVPEFTSVCPLTGMPDFGTLTVDYMPNTHCIELKAFKYYIHGYRNYGIFYENVVNKILDDLSQACEPFWMQVKGEFTARGGISTTVKATYAAPGFDLALV